MYDLALEKLREARAFLLEEQIIGKNSRELSVAITNLETAILWREKDLSLKAGPKNESSNS